MNDDDNDDDDDEDDEDEDDEDEEEEDDDDEEDDERCSDSLKSSLCFRNGHIPGFDWLREAKLLKGAPSIIHASDPNASTIFVPSNRILHHMCVGQNLCILGA